VFIIKNVKKAISRNKLSEKAKKSTKDAKRSILRIPAEIIDVSSQKYSLVKVKLVGKNYEDREVGKVYEIPIDFLEIPISIYYWNSLTKD